MQSSAKHFLLFLKPFQHISHSDNLKNLIGHCEWILYLNFAQKHRQLFTRVQMADTWIHIERFQLKWNYSLHSQSVGRSQLYAPKVKMSTKKKTKIGKNISTSRTSLKRFYVQHLSCSHRLIRFCFLFYFGSWFLSSFLFVCLLVWFRSSHRRKV